jgi:hypothetical protein
MTMLTRAFIACWIVAAAPAVAVAEEPAAAATAPSSSATSNLWLVAGGAFATLRGDCQNCEGDYPYRHSGSILGAAGYRVNRRMDVGAELFWVPVDTAHGRIRTTHVDAVAQFRPWDRHGFFLKGGAGTAFVRNWVDVIGPDAINSKALSVLIGGGWLLRPTRRITFEAFAAQHAAALGDLETATGDVSDVIGNFWSLGVALVIRP